MRKLPGRTCGGQALSIASTDTGAEKEHGTSSGKEAVGFSIVIYGRTWFGSGRADIDYGHCLFGQRRSGSESGVKTKKKVGETGYGSTPMESRKRVSRRCVV